MKDDIFFKKEEVQNILFQLIEKSKELKEAYLDIDNKCKVLNGEDDMWKGKGQESFYDNYLSISSDFELINDNIDECNRFLRSTILDYMKEDSTINNSIENNDNLLDIN